MANVDRAARAVRALLLIAASGSSALAAWTVVRHPALFERAAGPAGRWAAAAALAAAALLALVLPWRRARDTTTTAGVGVRLRLAIYAAMGAVALHGVLVERFHPELAPLLLAAALLGGSLAAELPAGRLPAALLRAADRLALAVCVFLVAGEIALRVWARLAPSPLFQRADLSTEERERLFGLPPGTEHDGFATNSAGHYDEEFAPRRPGGPRRVLSVGDSFAASVVPHAFHFTTVCEQELGDTEVLNLGVCTAGPWDYLRWIERDAPSLALDLVVACIFLGNDVHDAKRVSTGWISHRPLHRENLLLWLVPTRLLALRRGAADGGLGSAIAAGRATDRRGVPLASPAELLREKPWLADPLLERGTYGEADYLRIERARAREACGPETVGYGHLFEALERMHAASGTAPFAVLLLPDEFQVEDALWSDVVAGVPEPLERDRPQRLAGAWLSDRGIPFEDLLPRLRAVEPLGDGRRHVYALRDTHFNVRGNRVAGLGLAALVERVLGERRAPR